jgi:hypothetical protein
MTPPRHSVALPSGGRGIQVDYTSKTQCNRHGIRTDTKCRANFNQIKSRRSVAETGKKHPE